MTILANLFARDPIVVEGLPQATLLGRHRILSIFTNKFPTVGFKLTEYLLTASIYGKTLGKAVQKVTMHELKLHRLETQLRMARVEIENAIKLRKNIDEERARVESPCKKQCVRDATFETVSSAIVGKAGSDCKEVQISVPDSSTSPTTTATTHSRRPPIVLL